MPNALMRTNPQTVEKIIPRTASPLPRWPLRRTCKATILASLASLALSVAHTHEDEERRAENLNAALRTREIIGEASGILMERERITADQAFDILRRASQHLNIKLREVAQNLVDTGESPDTGPGTRY